MNQPETQKVSSQKIKKTGLKTKLIVTMMAVGTFPLLLAMIISYAQSNKSLHNIIGSSFKALAYESSTKIDFLLKKEINYNQRLAKHPTLSLYIKEQNRTYRNIPSDLEKYFADKSRLWYQKDAEMESFTQNSAAKILKRFMREDNFAFRATRALYLTDAKGTLVASINHVPPFLNNNQPEWEKTFQGGKGFTFLSDLHWDQAADDHVFQIAIPITDAEGTTIGVFHRLYAGKNFFSDHIEAILFGETGHVMLINSDGVVIDCPILPTGLKLSDPNLVKSVTGLESNWVMSQGDGHGSNELSIIGFSPLVETNKIIFNSTGKRWFTFAWQASHELFAHTQKLFLWISSAGIFSILLIAIMGSLASDRIVKPIRQLQKAAARIGHGEDVEDLEITSEDEIGSLAKEINSMKAMLKKSFSGLENQVEEKTQEVLYLKEYTERVLMSVPDVIMIFSEDSKIEFVNAAFERLTHTKGESLIGKTIQETDLSFKDKWEKIDKDLILHSKQFTKPVETETEPSSQKYEARDPLQPSQPTKAPKQITDIVTIENTTFAYQFFDVFIKVGETRRTGVLMRDITKEQHLQDQLALAEKLSGLGRLAAGIAHEMNNPLYSIMGYTEAILGENDSSKVKRFAQKILDSSKHMASVILNLSGYVRTNQDEATDININERLDAAIELATVSSYSNDIELEKNYAKLPLFKAKPEEIQQIFINLIKNSVQAMDGKGKLTISSNQNNGLIVIKIQDTGPGIPLEYQNKIFDPFFTTKQQGEGTGLGLNIVHRLVEKYGGEINVESELGKGTTFIISFATSSA